MVRAPNFSRASINGYNTTSIQPHQLLTTAMYKWHSQLARSSRPVSRDLQVVTDGIAASLRAFSISASQAAEEVAGTITLIETLYGMKY